MYTVDELKFSILAFFWNLRFWRDRQGRAFSSSGNAVTGLPDNESELLPASSGVSGDRLALENTPVPSGLAASMIKYETANGEMEQLDQKPRHSWTSQEIEIHGVLTHRIKLAAHQLAEEGCVNLRPVDDRGEAQPFGEDGMTARFQLTPKGLTEARQRVRGTKFEYAPRGWEDALAPSKLQHAPDWLKRQWREGNVSGTNGRLDVQVQTEPMPGRAVDNPATVAATLTALGANDNKDNKPTESAGVTT